MILSGREIFPGILHTAQIQLINPEEIRIIPGHSANHT
jgi:hypothetical protein